jgi:hypothetical protein
MQEETERDPIRCAGEAARRRRMDAPEKQTRLDQDGGESLTTTCSS